MNDILTKQRSLSLTCENTTNESKTAEKKIFSKVDSNYYDSIDSSIHLAVPKNRESNQHVDKDLDGGWGWAVAFGSFLMFTSYTAFFRVYPIIFEEIRERFESSAQKAAWLSATHNVIRFALGKKIVYLKLVKIGLRLKLYIILV